MGPKILVASSRGFSSLTPAQDALLQVLRGWRLIGDAPAAKLWIRFGWHRFRGFLEAGVNTRGDNGTNTVQSRGGQSMLYALKPTEMEGLRQDLR